MPAPSTCTVSGICYGPGATALSGVVVKAYITTGFTDASGNYVAAGVLASTTTASDGTWSLSVIRTAGLGHSVTFQFDLPLGNNQSKSPKYAAVIPDTSTANFADLVNIATGTAALASAPTTDALAEGSVNLYFTAARAQAACVSQTITTGVTTSAPSQDAVFDALALKITGPLTGDVTTSGAAATIANDAVTYAKMQNVSATDKLLGRSTAGSGDVEEITCTAAGRALIDDVDAAAQRTTLSLGNVDNTSDANKPVSTAQQTALDAKQPLDADLTAIAGLTSAADKVPYFTGSGTAALADFSSAGRALVDDASAAAQRATLGSTTVGDAVFIATNAAAAQTALSLVPGTNVQAYDAELAALASVTSAADKVPYFTGSGTASVTDLTATARSLLDDTSTSAMRTTLGLAIGTDVQAYDAQLSSLIRQNSQSAAYTTVLTDGGKHILHPTADNNARTFTIDSNANVAYPIGTAITFINEINTVTIAITSDTMKLSPGSTTGSRTLAAGGMATAIKTGSTTWWISGTGLT